MEDWKKTDMEQDFIDLANLIWSAWHIYEDEKQYVMASVETDKHL